MDLIKITKLLSASSLRTYRDDDYWIDRLCHRYSVVIFSTFAVLVTTKSYIGDPIDCWAPPEFKSSYERYAETLCFVNGTYYISSTEIDIPVDPTRRYSNRIRYYQWTPFILLLQAFTMFIPRILWLSLNTKYGISLRNLVDAAKKYETVDSYRDKEKILVYICKNLLRTINYNEFNNLNKKNNSQKKFDLLKKNFYLNHKYELNKMLNLELNSDRIKSVEQPVEQQDYSLNNFYSLKQRVEYENKKQIPDLSTTYLSALYLLIKFIYLLVSVIQMYLLNKLIGNKFYMIGLSLIKSFLLDIEWPHMDIFPRMTLCEIYIREVGTVHPYLIQCVLRINLFNEVIFIMVWYWLVFVIILTSTDLIIKLVNSFLNCSNCQKKQFALKYLELIHLGSNSNQNDNRLLLIENEEEELDLFESFCDINFNNDTIFALKLIEQNASGLIVSEIIQHLWFKFKFVNLLLLNNNNQDQNNRNISKKNTTTTTAVLTKAKKIKKHRNSSISK